jgi:hypothetical protein
LLPFEFTQTASGFSASELTQEIKNAPSEKTARANDFFTLTALVGLTQLVNVLGRHGRQSDQLPSGKG